MLQLPDTILLFTFVITFDFHTIIQLFFVSLIFTLSPLLLLCNGPTYLDSTFLTSKNTSDKDWNGLNFGGLQKSEYIPFHQTPFHNLLGF